MQNKKNNDLVNIEQPKQENDKEKYIDAEAEDVKVKEKSTEKENSNNKFIGAIIAIAVLLLVVALLMFGFNKLKPTGFGYSTENAQEVIHQQENPELKAEKLDPSKVYKLSEAKDTLNKLSVSIDKAQFRKDQTRLWVHFVNDGSQKINMMPNVNAVLVDNNGHSYKVDSFAGNQITGIAPGVSEEAMLVFEPIRADAKQITFHLDMVFDMKNPAWQISIPVDIP